MKTDPRLGYKLTTTDCCTRKRWYNETFWTPGVEVCAQDFDNALCTAGYIHYYRNKYIACFMNAKHANIQPFRLWSFRATGDCLHEPLKSGTRSGYIVEEIDVPKISIVQYVAFGILCSLRVYKKPEYIYWAQNWLNNTDRSKTSAAAAVANAATAAAAFAADANADAAAANAAYAATAAANAAYAAVVKPINFNKIALKAMTYS